MLGQSGRLRFCYFQSSFKPFFLKRLKSASPLTSVSFLEIACHINIRSNGSKCVFSISELWEAASTGVIGIGIDPIVSAAFINVEGSRPIDASLLFRNFIDISQKLTELIYNSLLTFSIKSLTGVVKRRVSVNAQMKRVSSRDITL